MTGKGKSRSVILITDRLAPEFDTLDDLTRFEYRCTTQHVFATHIHTDAHTHTHAHTLVISQISLPFHANWSITPHVYSWEHVF